MRTLGRWLCIVGVLGVVVGGAAGFGFGFGFG
jgi:hypothetical protein